MEYNVLTCFEPYVDGEMFSQVQAELDLHHLQVYLYKVKDSVISCWCSWQAAQPLRRSVLLITHDTYQTTMLVLRPLACPYQYFLT